jgi:rubrerythrin
MGTLDTLKTIETLEHRLGQLYERYSGLLANDSEAAAFFTQLCREEDIHKGLVQLQCRMLTSNPKEFDRVHLDVEPLADILEELEGLLRAQPPKDLDGMVRVAFYFESHTAEDYYRAVIETASDDMAQLLRFLSQGSSDHLKRVQEFAQERGFPAAVPAKPA